MTNDQFGTNADSTTEAKKQAASQEAANVKDTALDAGANVKDSALSEAADLKDHALDHAQNLLGESRQQVGSRIAQGQSQLASTVREFSDELRNMAQHGQGGYANEIASQVASTGHQVATYLDRHEPGDVVDEVRRFAARRPMAFLGISLAAGIVAGRVARGIQGSQSDAHQPQSLMRGSQQAYDRDTYTSPSTYGGHDTYSSQTHLHTEGARTNFTPATGDDFGHTEGTGFGNAQYQEFGHTEGLGQGTQNPYGSQPRMDDGGLQ